MDVIPVYHTTSTVPATDNRLDRTRIATTTDPASFQLSYLASSSSFTVGRFRGSNSQNDCNIIGITVKNLQLKMAWYSKYIDLCFQLHLEQSI